MNELAALICCALIYGVSACCSYCEALRRSPWFVVITLALGAVSSALWCLMVRSLNDSARIYVFGLCWDTVMCAVFYLAPLVFFGVRLERTSVAGLCLMVAGLVLLKWKK